MTDDIPNRPFGMGREITSGPGEPMTTDFSTPLMEITSSIMPLSIVFDCVAYLDRDHTEVEMFDMIQRLKAACE